MIRPHFMDEDDGIPMKLFSLRPPNVNRAKLFKQLRELKKSISAKDSHEHHSKIDRFFEILLGMKFANVKDLRWAALVDDQKEGNPLVKELMDMNVDYTTNDVKFIEKVNPSAAEMLKEKLEVKLRARM